MDTQELDFKEELKKLVFGDDLEFIHGEEFEFDFEQHDAFEYNNPVDTICVGSYSEIIQGTAHGEWKYDSDYIKNSYKVPFPNSLI